MAEDMTAFEKPEDLCKWLEIKFRCEAGKA